MFAKKFEGLLIAHISIVDQDEKDLLWQLGSFFYEPFMEKH